ncbi:MAG TPA: hypothetical protein V6D14_04960 [Coleofasciculaceae cyanobacterium]|jgi:hypothetical protein
MKIFKHLMVFPATLTMLLTSVTAVRSQPIQLAPGFVPDPLVVTGTSGGSQAAQGCGKVGATPNHVFNLSDNFNYLRFSVQSAGQPTLLIQGPNGSSCVQADSFSKGTIQLPGYWEKGSYSVYVGDRAEGQNAYTLSLTQKR